MKIKVVSPAALSGGRGQPAVAGGKSEISSFPFLDLCLATKKSFIISTLGSACEEKARRALLEADGPKAHGLHLCFLYIRTVMYIYNVAVNSTKVAACKGTIRVQRKGQTRTLF